MYLFNSENYGDTDSDHSSHFGTLEIIVNKLHQNNSFLENVALPC